MIPELVDAQLSRRKQREQLLASPKLDINGLETARSHQLGN